MSQRVILLGVKELAAVLRLTFLAIPGHAFSESIAGLEAAAACRATGQMVCAAMPCDLLMEATRDLAVVASTERLSRSS